MVMPITSTRLFSSRLYCRYRNRTDSSHSGRGLYRR